MIKNFEKYIDLEKKIEKTNFIRKKNIYIKRLSQLNIFIEKLICAGNKLNLNLIYSNENNLFKFIQKIEELEKLIKDINLLQNKTTVETNNINYKKINNEFKYLEEKYIFNKKYDKLNSFMEIQSGAGGLDAQDWVEILYKMYTTWFEKKNFNYEIIDISKNEKIGIKFICIKINAEYAYGWLKNENGIHRLVRRSPFDTNNKRHTSFASVFVYPEIKIENKNYLDLSDLRIDTYRSSGAGGQHVNKTDSAVRITHIPTKISVQCQSERSQHKNKNMALKQLNLKLNAFNLIKKKYINKTAITWGEQIRSYVLDKSYIKDIRLKNEITKINFILEGNLDSFILSILKN